MPLTLTPTTEQTDILDAASPGGTVAIAAGAGTGKTSTLRLLASARPRTRMLYVAYNKTIQVEAANSFPPNVTCETAHLLAYAKFGAPMSARLNGPRMRGFDVARILGITQFVPRDDPQARPFRPSTLGSWSMGIVGRFCRSASPTIKRSHFVPPEGVSPSEAARLVKILVPLAQTAWADLMSPTGRLRPTHDVYLKQWQLSKPYLTGWDLILYDEAQDADPAIADVVEHQHHAQLIAVGDSAQAIY